MPNDPPGFLAMALAVIAAPGPAVAHVLLSSVVLAFFASASIGFLDPDLPPWPQSGVLALLYLRAAMFVHGRYAMLATRLHDSALLELVGAQRALRLAAAVVTLCAAGLVALRAAG